MATMNSTVKALTVLETVAGASKAIRLADIAKLAQLTKPTAHRILQTLVEAGYVLADGDGGYSAGPRLLGLAGLTLRDREYRRLVRPHLEALQDATGHTVHFALLGRDDAVYVEKVEPVRAYQMASVVGMHIPLHCTAIGKSILSQLPAAEAQARLGSDPYPVRTPATLTTWRRLAGNLVDARERGFAIDDEENESNVRCVGAHVRDNFGNVCGAVSVSALAFLFSYDEAVRTGQVVRDTASAVSQALGAPPLEIEAG